MKQIAIQFYYPALALTVTQAAKALNVSRKTIWRLKATGKIKATAYGVIPVFELDRHLRQEIESQRP